MDHHPHRRPTAVATFALVASLVLAPAPAEAAAIDEASIDGFVGAYHTNTTGCLTTTTPNQPRTPVPPGRTVTRTVSGSSTTNHTGGAVTRTTMRASGTATVQGRGGQLGSTQLTASGRVESTEDPGQVCRVAAWTQVDHEVAFRLDRPQWLVLTSSATRDTSAYLELEPAGPVGKHVSYEDRSGGEHTATWFLPAGSYEVDLGLYWEVVAEDESSLQRVRSGSGRIRLDLHDGGSATSVTTGRGRRHVALADAATCANRSVAATFRRTGTVRKAVLTVDGRRARSVRRPEPGRTYVVPGLPATRGATVGVRLVVDPPGPRRTKVVTARRSYRACAPA
ncbi:hypothetical protein [Nocardioides sp. SYSU D00038]|uniref:hypothetical protein n=1 Tax=Nocardioides sp. SYSU D00038 TaxID=2812554 RepID=UPI0019672D76|nr:hypothetical protein [Nocardioides sp. SYSU D00038]